jgi:hypothetical protein
VPERILLPIVKKDVIIKRQNPSEALKAFGPRMSEKTLPPGEFGKILDSTRSIRRPGTWNKLTIRSDSHMPNYNL